MKSPSTQTTSRKLTVLHETYRSPSRETQVSSADLKWEGVTDGFTPSELGETIRTPCCKGSCDVMQNFIVTYNDVPRTSSASVLLAPFLSQTLSSLEFKPGDNFSFYDKLFSCHHISLPHTPNLHSLFLLFLPLDSPPFQNDSLC